MYYLRMEPHLDLSKFVFFADVVDAGSFTLAGRRMQIDRSNISRGIKELERSAGAQLLRRTTRKMVLTELGEAFYEQCLNIRNEVNQAKNILLSNAEYVRGPIHVSCPPALGRLFLLPALEKFCRLYPDVSVRITLKSGLIDLIEERVDVALRFTDEPEQNLVARNFWTTEWFVCASPEYVREKGQPENPDELSSHAWIGIQSKVTLKFKKKLQRYRAMLLSRITCADYDVIGKFALDGLGIALLPGHVATPAIKEKKLIHLLKSFSLEETPGSTLYALTLPGPHTPPQVKAFLAFIKQKLLEV